MADWDGSVTNGLYWSIRACAMELVNKINAANASVVPFLFILWQHKTYLFHYVLYIYGASVPAHSLYYHIFRYVVELVMKYLKDRFNYGYLTLRFGYPSQFADTFNCGIAKYQLHPGA